MGKRQKMIDYAVSIANDDSHGYSQSRRWPEEGTDFDCSSLMYESASQAGYDVKHGWPRYTGSMPEDFKKAGFACVAFDGNLGDLEAGDILVNVSSHTEMCIGGGRFVGAHIAETGGVDGKPGDQTGNEISICDAYIYPDGWDYVLVPPAESGESGSGTTKSSNGGFDDGPRFCVRTDGGWLDDMVGTRDTGGSSDKYAGILGKSVKYVAIDGVGKYRVCTKANGWLPYVKKFDKGDLENGCAGDGSDIIAIQIPSSKVRYAAHDLNGGWNADMVGTRDTGGSSDKYAGSMSAIDAIRIAWA